VFSIIVQYITHISEVNYNTNTRCCKSKQ